MSIKVKVNKYFLFQIYANAPAEEVIARHVNVKRRKEEEESKKSIFFSEKKAICFVFVLLR